MKPALVILFLLSYAPSALGAPPSVTWKQCNERGGEPFSGFHPNRCPDGQHLIGRVKDAHCACVCCSPVGQATEFWMYASPIIETRGRHRSVWGISLTLSAPLADPFNPKSISIIESKHSRELRRLMDFRLNQKGKELEIKFKPGKGDFGSGNTVHVSINSGVILANGKKSTKNSATDMKTDLWK